MQYERISAPGVPKRSRYVDSKFGTSCIFFCCACWSSQGSPGAIRLCLGGVLQVSGSLELQNGTLRALKEAWMTTLGIVLSSLVVFCASVGACRARRGRSGKVGGSLRKRRRRSRRRRRRRKNKKKKKRGVILLLDGRVLDTSGGEVNPRIV